MLDDDSKLLANVGFGESRPALQRLSLRDSYIPENETEVSFFNMELYEAFKANPEVCCTPTSTSVA